MTTYRPETIHDICTRFDIPPNASATEVRAHLRQQGWHASDIERVVIAFTDPESTTQPPGDALHLLMRTDARLRPETLSALLGVSCDISSVEIDPATYARPRVTWWRFLVIFVVGAILAVMVLGAIMWVTNSGLFHPSLW